MAQIKMIVLISLFSLILCVQGRELDILKKRQESMFSDLVSKLSKKQECEEYVCSDVYEEEIAAITSMVDMLNSMVGMLQSDIIDVDSKVDTQYAETSSAISTLQTNFDTNTVRKCLNGVYTYACDPYCGDKGEDWAGGVVNTVTFSSTFHTNPFIVLSIQRYDDYDGSDVRFDYRVTQRSTTQFQFTLKTYQDSRMSYIDIGWIACA